jgi:hypothetical protein
MITRLTGKAIVLSAGDMWMMRYVSENTENERFGDRMSEGGMSGWTS